MVSEEIYYGLGDDPVLGKFIAHYPSDRTRLLLIAGGVLAVVWFITTVILWGVEDRVAFPVTVIVLSLSTLVVGWFLAHWWNREVVMYERGFSYREGSHTAFIRYADVSRLRQRAERRSYFGGRVRRTVYDISITTDQEEHIHLNKLYRRVDELSLRFDQRVTAALLEKAHKTLDEGGRLSFGSGLSLSGEGIHDSEHLLPWEDVGGHNVQNRQLHIHMRGGDVWTAVPLAGLDNLRLLVELLRENTPEDTS